MIELVDHFGLVKRHVTDDARLAVRKWQAAAIDLVTRPRPLFWVLIGADPIGAFAHEPRFCQLLGSAEHAGVVRHVEQSREADAPRVTLLPLGFVDEYWYASVDLLRQLSIGFGAEHRCRLRVWIDPTNVIRRKWVLALFTVGDVYASLCKKGAYAPFSAN